MESCYDYFKCKKPACPAYENTQSECWDIEGTLCNSEHIEVLVKHEKNKCSYCQYYKTAHK
jgi:hypothetical protein